MTLQNSLQVCTLLFFSLLFSSCDPNRLYETNLPVANENWRYEDVKSFAVEVKDTTTRYNIFINLRHDFSFEWRNVYLQITTTLPSGETMKKRINLPLCENDGKWYGRCLGNNCDLPVSIQKDAKFPQLGTYHFTLQHDMRVNPLPKIKAVGLRVERAVKEKKE